MILNLKRDQQNYGFFLRNRIIYRQTLRNTEEIAEQGEGFGRSSMYEKMLWAIRDSAAGGGYTRM